MPKDLYVLTERYTKRTPTHPWKTDFKTTGSYPSHGEAKAAMQRVNLAALARSHRLLRGETLLEVAAEIYMMTKGGDEKRVGRVALTLLES